jgi:ribonuclease BN (tRNA processing enzyme)
MPFLVESLMTVREATMLADWVALHERRLTTIYITHGHGDHYLSPKGVTVNCRSGLRQVIFLARASVRAHAVDPSKVESAVATCLSGSF